MKLFYSTDEVVEHLNIPKTTLEYYLLEFKINIKKAGRNRKFSHKDIEKLQRIIDLITKEGFTLEGAKEQLRQKKKTENENEEVIARLLEIKKSLVFLRNGIPQNE
jgi:DNA-binding transcriptional MerR regulator